MFESMQHLHAALAARLGSAAAAPQHANGLTHFALDIGAVQVDFLCWDGPQAHLCQLACDLGTLPSAPPAPLHKTLLDLNYAMLRDQQLGFCRDPLTEHYLVLGWFDLRECGLDQVLELAQLCADTVTELGGARLPEAGAAVSSAR
jgi:hypothetical protein